MSTVSQGLVIETRPSTATVAIATLTTTIAIFPVFFLGGLAALVRAELGFDRAALGFAVGLFFAASALSSVPLGRWTERVGATMAAVVAVTLSALVMVGLALTSRWLHIAALMVVGGIANGLAQPTSNVFLARGVPNLSQGLAFGIKQSGPPLAGLLAGMSVPAVGLTLGWRPAFVLGGILAGLVGVRTRLGLRGEPPKSPRRPPGNALRHGDAPLAPLALLGVAGGFASAASQPLGAFLVETGVARGLSTSMAGTVLAVGSATSILARIVAGHVIDRYGGSILRLLMAMVGIGSLAYLGLARATSPLAFVGLSVLAFAFGWGWNGLAHFAVVRGNTNAPGAASGITLVGFASGAVVGPITFGLASTHASFLVAWTLCAISAIVSVALMEIVRRWLRRGGIEL